MFFTKFKIIPPPLIKSKNLKVCYVVNKTNVSIKIDLEKSFGTEGT